MFKGLLQRIANAKDAAFYWWPRSLRPAPSSINSTLRLLLYSPLAAPILTKLVYTQVTSRCGFQLEITWVYIALCSIFRLLLVGKKKPYNIKL